jgi:hypothetical protein
MISMKVLVRNGDTGLFLKGGSSWTDKPVEAQDFGLYSNAIDGVRGMSLRNAEIVLSFSDASLDVRIPLHHSPKGADAADP